MSKLYLCQAKVWNFSECVKPLHISKLSLIFAFYCISFAWAREKKSMEILLLLLSQTECLLCTWLLKTFFSFSVNKKVLGSKTHFIHFLSLTHTQAQRIPSSKKVFDQLLKQQCVCSKYDIFPWYLQTEFTSSLSRDPVGKVWIGTRTKWEINKNRLQRSHLIISSCIWWSNPFF